MEPGICYIKPEYLLPDVKTQASANYATPLGNGNKRKSSDDEDDVAGKKTTDKLNSDKADGNEPNGNKRQKWDKKKERKRGQNKNRPVYKEDRTLHLCHSLVNGPSADAHCALPNCRYVHDVAEYMAAKGDDLGAECIVYTVKGYCPRGITCRYAKVHLDEQGRNMEAPNYDPLKAPTTINGITSEMQVRLRKRDYDFSRAKDVIAHFDKIREEQKQKKPAKEEKHKNEGGAEIKEEQIELGQALDKKWKDELAAELKEKKPIGCLLLDDPSERAVCSVDFSEKLVLSPLTTVGNLPFRRICKEFGADITCGEMACAVPIVKGLTQEWALTKRHISEDVFGVQLCGNNPTIIAQAAQLLHETAKVDYVDLNIGCPIDLIYQQGGGSALMRRTNILEVTTRTCSALSQRIPFTVKMRTGVYADKSVAHELMPLVEKWGASAVTLHGRSREQRYTKHANWNYIEQCAAQVKRIPVIGNGDILSFKDYNERRQQAPHVSSVMIGRGALIKPWIFKEIKEQQYWDPTSAERFEILQKYTNYGLEHWGSDTRGVETTRRFLLEWQSFLYRYIPYDLLLQPPQQINQRPEKFRGRDELETLMSSPNADDWVRISEMLLGKVPEGFTFVPKHKANSY